MVSTISKHSPRHRSCSSSDVRNFTNNLSNHFVPAATMHAAFLFIFKNTFFYQHCKRLIYTSCGTGIFIFKPVPGWVVFSLSSPWTGWFRNYRFWDGLQFIYFPFNSRFLDVDGPMIYHDFISHDRHLFIFLLFMILGPDSICDSHSINTHWARPHYLLEVT
jgi:hypothetical protein